MNEVLRLWKFLFLILAYILEIFGAVTASSYTFEEQYFLSREVLSKSG